MNRDLVLTREDLTPAALRRQADLLREAPASAGCLLDVRGANEALADILEVVAAREEGRHVAAADHVFPVALACWVSALVPGLIVTDARGGEALETNRRRFVALFGPEVGPKFLEWVHACRVALEKKEVGHASESDPASPAG